MKNHFCPWGDFFLKKEIVFISTSPTPPVLIPLSSKLVFDHHRFPPPQKETQGFPVKERKKEIKSVFEAEKEGRKKTGWNSEGEG